MNRLSISQLGLVLVALVLFHVTIGLPLLSAGAPYWVEPRGDMASMMAGHHAIIDHPWNFPLTVTTALRGEAMPVSVVYTDSLPWLTILMKALGVGRVINVLAVFMLASYVAQPLAMVALLKACGVTRTSSLVVGGLLALFYPAWFVRQFGHIALAGHWLLLFSLAWSVQVARFGLTRRRVAEIAALGALATGIHAYHLVPVAACLGAGMLSELLQKRDRALRSAALAVVGFTAGVGLSAWLLGYGVGGGQSGGGGAIGAYSMNLLGPVWPQASTLAGQTWNGTWFTGTLDANGAQTFEGYAYLGAGVLLLIVAAGVIRVRRRSAEPLASDLAAWRRFGPLLAAMIALTLYAIGPRPYFGMQLLFDLGKPSGRLGDVIGLFRAHGRFFWIVGYALLAIAIVQIDKLKSERVRLGLLIAAIALQAVDMTQMIRGVRTAYAPVEPYYDPIIRTDPAFARRPWRFQPLIECVSDLDAWTIIQMSAQALRRQGTSNSGPTARAFKVDCAVDPAAKQDAVTGDRTITAVIGDRVARKALFDEFNARNDCYVFNRGLLCGRDLADVPGLQLDAGLTAELVAAAPVIHLNRGVRPAALGAGWGLPEPRGAWTDGKRAELTIDHGGASNFALIFDVISIGPSKDGSQRVEVAIGDRVITRAKVRTGTFIVTVTGAPPGRSTHIELRLPDAASPPPFNGQPDPRLLGIGVSEIRVVPLKRSSARPG